MIDVVLHRIDQQARLPFTRLRLAFHDDQRIRHQLFLEFLIGAREDHRFALPLAIFQLDKGHLIALFGVDGAHAGDHPGQGDILAVMFFAQFITVAGDNFTHVDPQTLHRMTRRVDAQEFFLPGQLFAPLDFFDIGQTNRRNRCCATGQEVKHRELTTGTLVVDASRVGYHLVNDGQQLAALAKTVKGADFDQTFDGPLADLAQIDTVGKLFQAAKGAALLPGSENLFHRPFAHHLHRRHAKADGAARRHGKLEGEHRVWLCPFHPIRQALNVKVQAAIVDIGWHYTNAHTPALVDKVDHLFSLVALDQE